MSYWCYPCQEEHTLEDNFVKPNEYEDLEFDKDEWWEYTFSYECYQCRKTKCLQKIAFSDISDKDICHECVLKKAKELTEKHYPTKV